MRLAATLIAVALRVITIPYPVAIHRRRRRVRLKARADWCLCTIPLPILAQIPMNVGAAMASPIAAVPYASAIKVGLQFKRRFWEEDEHIYGGITYTEKYWLASGPASRSTKW
jgi:monoamine oxidase